MKYCGKADVDGSCIPWTEVVFRGRKLYPVDGSCIPWTEVALWSVNGRSLACYPPHLVKVKINFDEAQKLKRKEMKFFLGLIKRVTSDHICELLKMQIESRS